MYMDETQSSNAFVFRSLFLVSTLTLHSAVFFPASSFVFLHSGKIFESIKNIQIKSINRKLNIDG